MTLLRKAAERYAKETGTPLTVVGSDVTPDDVIPGCSHGSTSPHPCPYRHDVNNDPETLCTCCADCQHECAMDI
jgi:hypothetical protein